MTKNLKFIDIDSPDQKTTILTKAIATTTNWQQQQQQQQQKQP